MRHAPYAAAVAAANGGEELASMAISAATTAEDGWFGGSGASSSGGQNRSGVGRAGGGGSVEAASNGVAGRAARQDLAAAWLTSGEVHNLSTSSEEQRRSSSNLASIDEQLVETVEEASDDEVICSRSGSDKRSLFWSAFSATLVPSKRADTGEKRHIRRRNPFRQRKRRPNLSNVVEAQHENGAGSGVSELVGSDSVGSDHSASVACKVSTCNPCPVNGDCAVPSGVDLNCQAITTPASEGQLESPASKSTFSASNCAIPAPKSAILTSKPSIATSKSRSGSLVPLNGSANSENYVWQRGRIFTSVPEDEDDDSVCELDTNCAERTGLLERSASVPDAEPKVIRWAAKAAKAASMTSVASNSFDLSDTGDAVKRSHSSGSDASTGGSGSKLGKWSKSKIDLLVPSIKSLVTMTTNKLASSSSKASINCHRRSGCSGSTSNLFASSSTSFARFDVGALDTPPKVEALRRNISLSCMANGCRYEPMNARSTDNLAGAGALTKKLRKCNTMVALTGGGGCSVSTNPCGALHLEPMQPINRLRVSSQEFQAASRMCSRCSSLLSMASSSRYSLNSSYGFVPVSGVLCKVCLNEVPLKDSWTLQHCECSYCVDCVRSYVEFEINQGAYSISCPDAQCEKQGIIMLEEIESLVSLENHEKHKRYRLNREVEMDKSRTWCPRAGCETVCTLCSTDRCTPQSVHCPTCKMDFCSNCRAAWHADSPCKSEEVVPGVTFDSELIKCCPMCSVPIEKDEGCAQMLCKRCKHVFCWYCLASLDDDFLLRHYDKGPCKNKLGHSRASVIWHRTQVISIFAGFGILLLIASPLLLLAAPCIVCCKCRVCSSDTKLDVDDDLPEAAELQTNVDLTLERGAEDVGSSGAETHS